MQGAHTHEAGSAQRETWAARLASENAAQNIPTGRYVSAGPVFSPARCPAPARFLPGPSSVPAPARLVPAPPPAAAQPAAQPLSSPVLLPVPRCPPPAPYRLVGMFPALTACRLRRRWCAVPVLRRRRLLRAAGAARRVGRRGSGAEASWGGDPLAFGFLGGHFCAGQFRRRFCRLVCRAFLPAVFAGSFAGGFAGGFCRRLCWAVLRAFLPAVLLVVFAGAFAGAFAGRFVRRFSPAVLAVVPWVVLPAVFAGGFAGSSAGGFAGGFSGGFCLGILRAVQRAVLLGGCAVVFGGGIYAALRGTALRRAVSAGENFSRRRGRGKFFPDFLGAPPSPPLPGLLVRPAAGALVRPVHQCAVVVQPRRHNNAPARPAYRRAGLTSLHANALVVPIVSPPAR